MDQSSGCFEAGLEWRPGLEHGPEDVDAPACQRDDGLVVAFSFAPLALVEGSAVIVCQRAESRLVEHALGAFVAAVGSSEESGSAGLAKHRGHSGGRGEGVGGAEAGEVACLGDELCGEHGPHAGQAADEGRVRVALEQRLQLAVEFDQACAACQRLDGEFADQARGHALGGHGDGLLGRDGENAIGQLLDLGQAACCLQVVHQALSAGSAQLARRDELAQQVQWSLGLEVEAGFQAGEDADKQVAHAGQALRLRLHDVATPAGQQPDLKVQLAGGLDRPQVRPGTDLVGDGASVARVGFVLTADGALAEHG